MTARAEGMHIGQATAAQLPAEWEVLLRAMDAEYAHRAQVRAIHPLYHR